MQSCHRARVVPGRSRGAGWGAPGTGCPGEGLRVFMALLGASPLTLPGCVNAGSSPVWLVGITRASSDCGRDRGKQPFAGAGGHFCIIFSGFPPQKGSFLAHLGPAGPAPRGAQGRADGDRWVTRGGDSNTGVSSFVSPCLALVCPHPAARTAGGCSATPSVAAAACGREERADAQARLEPTLLLH